MLLEARNVTRAFGSFKAVDAVSVTLEQGDILGLIGPNGAGKSTFFNCLTGDILSTSGNVLFEGHDITNRPPEARAKPSAMCAPPISPRGMMKRMALRRPIASSIGRLWTDATPNTVEILQAARNSATRSATLYSPDMPALPIMPLFVSAIVLRC